MRSKEAGFFEVRIHFKCLNIIRKTFFTIKVFVVLVSLYINLVISLFVYLLRSRGTRERILIWFHRREKSRFVDCKLAAPVGFCRGFGPRFRVHLSRHACSL